MISPNPSVYPDETNTITPLRFKHKPLIDLIGNTPMARLEMGTAPLILAKLEYLNPGGSIKDRAAKYMIEEAERKGLLKPGGTIIEASSGNQGIALSMIGAIRGYQVIIVVPSRTSKEKRATLQAYGAELVVCEPEQSSHKVALSLAKTMPDAFMPNQYFNPANPMGHFTTTGPEIWEQSDGLITHFFAGAGSCGTIMGVARYLKSKNPAIKTIGVDAATSAFSSPNPTNYQTEGLGIDYPDGLIDTTFVDQVVPVSDEVAFEMTRTLAREHGILVGPSSGAVMHTALEHAKNLSATDVVVVVLADSGRAYLSKVFNL